MKKHIIIIACFVMAGLTSCKKFLEEVPKSQITPDEFYTTPLQAQTAVNGCYKGLEAQFDSRYFGLSISDWISVETLSGFATRPFINNAEDIQFTDLTRIEPLNLYVGGQWRNNYFPINNCNSVIQNLTGSTLIDEATRNKFLGEAYFLRAYYYFQLVRLFGDVPLRIVPVTTLEEANAPRNKQEAVFEQIVSDLKQAETSGLPGLSSDGTGRVTMTAIKSLLAKVYLNMAGYPLNRGDAYYQLAYDKAVEVINSGQASLIPDFKNILIAANENKTENIFMVQREATYAQSIMHYSMLPYPVPNPQLSANNNIGGAMEVVRPFFDSYAAGDIRKNQNYLWDYDYPNNDDRFIMVYKYWDQTAVVSGLSGQNIPLIRYADVLLIAAEAKANVDGGATSDGAALQAYYLVHHRGVPTAAQPASITVDDVLRERFWEFCFENQTWFDMVRTQKTMDVASPAAVKPMVPLIGHKAPAHVRAFETGDMVLPIPQNERDNNPRILEPPI